MRWPWQLRESEVIRLIDLYLLDAAKTRDLAREAVDDAGSVELPGFGGQSGPGPEHQEPDPP